MIEAFRNWNAVRFLWLSILRTFERFPYVLIAACLTAAAWFYKIDFATDVFDSKIALTLSLGIPLFLAITLFRESRGWISAKDRISELVVGSAVLCAQYFATESDTTANYFYRYVQLSLALHLAVAFVAFLPRGRSTGFWQFNRQVFLRILLSTLYAGVFYAGITIAIVTAKVLFSLHVPDLYFLKLWILTIYILQTWHFLAGLPVLTELNDHDPYPQGLRVFIQYLLIPLVSLYTLILYCYMAKILMTRDWPSGSIGWLVSVMSVLGIFNLLMIDPEKKNPRARWVTTYATTYYILILPLMALLFTAVGKRIEAYGFTEQRYYLAVLGLLLTALSLYFLFSRKKSVKIVPISLSLVALLSVWGPWSAASVSLRSQKARALTLLKENGLWNGTVAAPSSQQVSDATSKQLSSIFDYLIQNHGVRALDGLFPQSQIANNRNAGNSRNQFQDSQPFMEHLGLKHRSRWETDSSKSRTFNISSDIKVNAVPLEPYRHLTSYTYRNYAAQKPQVVQFQSRSLSITFDSPKLQIVISEKDRKDLILPLESLLTKWVTVAAKAKTKDEIKETYPIADLSLDVSAPDLSVRLLIIEVGATRLSDQLRLDSLEALLLFK